MKNSIKKGLGFGLTSGIITTLGLIIGLYSGTKSTVVVIGGIIIIAVADSLSDGLGMHISEETNSKNSKKAIWESTISTSLFKFVFAMSFVFPFLFFSLSVAVWFSVAWGFILIAGFSYHVANKNKDSTSKVVAEHLVITILVVIATYFIGRLINNLFS